MTTFTTPGDLPAAVPVENHAMLADGRTVALLTPDATVTWFCPPTPDAGAVFAHLLGGPSAGYFSVRPSVAAGRGETPPFAQDYRAGTMTIETRWPGLVVTDWLAHVKRVCRTDLVRRIRGTVPALVEFAPRPKFGAVLDPEPDGLRVLDTSDPMALRSPGVQWTVTSEGSHQTVRALVDPADGEVVFELRFGSNDLPPDPTTSASVNGATSSGGRSGLMGCGCTPWNVASSLSLRCSYVRCACRTRVPSWPPRPPRCPRRSAASATGTTGFCWCGTRPSTRTLVSIGSADEAQRLLHWLHRVLRTDNSSVCIRCTRSVVTLSVPKHPDQGHPAPATPLSHSTANNLTASVRAIIAERYTIPVTLRAARRAYALGHGTNEARVTTRFINQPVRHKGYNPGAA